MCSLTGLPMRLRTSDGEISLDNPGPLFDPEEAGVVIDPLFNTYTPAQVASMKPNNAVRQQFIALAVTLDDYNNGYTGPGHCSE